MISNRHKCIFVHIPRCGGTSVESVIWPGQRTEDELWQGFIDRFHNKYQTDGLQHLLARQVRQEVGDSCFTSYFKFTVVRNPFDRVVSQFSYMKWRPDLRDFIGMSESASFSEYIELIRRKEHAQWKPQCSFIYDDDGTPLMDFMGRFETLERDMQSVFERLGLGRQELPHRLKTDRAPYRDYYSPANRALIEEMYEPDFDRLGYAY